MKLIIPPILGQGQSEAITIENKTVKIGGLVYSIEFCAEGAVVISATGERFMLESRACPILQWEFTKNGEKQVFDNLIDAIDAYLAE